LCARSYFAKIHADRVYVHAKWASIAGRKSGVGAGHHGFGRRASGIDAGATEEFSLHNCYLASACGQSRCKKWAGLTGSDNDRIKVLLQGTLTASVDAAIKGAGALVWAGATGKKVLSCHPAQEKPDGRTHESGGTLVMEIAGCWPKCRD